MARFCLILATILVAVVFRPAASQELEGSGVFRRYFEVGRNGTLTCSWSGLKKPSHIVLVKWKFNGRRLREGGSRYIMTRDGYNHTLTIVNLKGQGDKGTYTCTPKFKKSSFQVTEGNFIVEVNKARLPDPPAARTLSLYEGRSTNVSCNYYQAKMRYGLQLFWTFEGLGFQDDTMVSPNSNVTYRTMADNDGRDWLELNNLDTAASGQYKCNYKYPDKQIFAMTFDIEVQQNEGREFERNATWKEDQFLGRLMCDLSSLENVTIEKFFWEIDGEELMYSTEKYNMTEKGDLKFLAVNNIVKENDEGVYRCVAQLRYYPIAVKFNVMIEKSKKEIDFTEWTEWSVCDASGRRFKFRVCTEEGCLERYGYVYDVATENC